MKKLFAFLLCLCFIFTLSACGKDDNKGSVSSIDLEYYADLGQIPEVSFRLGTDIEKIKAQLEKEDKEALDKGEEYVNIVTEGELSVCIDNGNAVYYYEKEKIDNGVSYIVSKGNAFNIESGTSVLDVKEALTEYKFTEEAANDDNCFFLFGLSSGQILKYKFDNIEVIFIFDEGGLTACAMYDTDNWTI